MSFRHSNVIPSFKCHSVIPKSLHVLQNWNLVVCHSGVIPCRNDFGMTYLSVWGHSQMEWFGMTIALIPLEWQGWPWNDWTGPRMMGWGGLRRGHSNFHPCHSCPIPSFRRHPGMQFQWGWASNDGGMSPAEGPKFVTFPACITLSINSTAVNQIVTDITLPVQHHFNLVPSETSDQKVIRC